MGLFKRSFSGQQRDSANYLHLVVDIVWFGLAFPALSRFLQVYAIKLGAREEDLFWMAALQSLVLIFSASLGARWMMRFTDSGRSVLLPGLGFRLSFLLPALTPLLPQPIQVPWLIASLVLPALPQGIASVAFLVMFREAVLPERVPALLSHRMIALNLAVAASGLAMGFWLERAPFPLNYSLLFVVAFILSLFSAWHVTRIRVLPELASESAPSTSSLPRSAVWRSPAFIVVVAVVMVTHISFTAVQPIVPMHLVRDLGAGEEFIGLYALAELLASAAVAVFAQRLIAWLGNRTMIAWAMVLNGLSVVIIAVTPYLGVTLLGAALGGGSWILVAIGVFALFSESTPQEHKTVFTTAYNQAVFVAMFLGPMLGMGLKLVAAESGSLTLLLLAGAILRVGAGLACASHPRAWMVRRRSRAAVH